MGRESLPGLEGQPSPSLLETHGDVMVTIEGVAMPLKVWFNFCPVPHDQLDPLKVEQAAQDFLDGKNPFAQQG